MVQLRLPRLVMQDMKDMRRAVAALVAAADTVKRSGWASAPAVHALIYEAIMVIGPLHDRAEPRYLEILKQLGPAAAAAAAAEASANDHQGGDPGADPGGSEGD